MTGTIDRCLSVRPLLLPCLLVLVGLALAACASGDGDPPTPEEICAVCDANADCEITAGVPTCTCLSGYQDATGDGRLCNDIDECATSNHDCGERAVCNNTLGGFECECASGYTGDGRSCADIDECAEPDTCANVATCMNYDGSYSCTCDPGYEGDGVTCTDIDECMTGSHGCDENATCNNLEGGHECICNDGYTGDGVTCTDLDECLLGTDDCTGLTACSNLPGSYECVCPPGYLDEFGDSSSCLLGGAGRVILIGHDYFVSNDDNNRILGNAVFSANTTDNVEILAYTGYADNAPGQEVSSVNAVINARAAELGRSFTLSTFTDPTQLNNLLFDKHVLLIYEQESANASTMNNLGSTWAITLHGFLDGGGTIVVSDYDGDTWRLLTGAGLLDITDTGTTVSGTEVYVTEPGHLIARDVGTNYPATTGTRYYAVSNAVPVVTDPQDRGIVWVRSQSGACVTIDDFEAGVWPNGRWRPGVGNDTGAVQQSAAHDFYWGLQNPEWHYHIDTTAGRFGERLRVWIRMSNFLSRANMGFGATVKGTYSLAINPVSGTLTIEHNANYIGITNLSSASFSPTYGKWYQLEVQFGSAGLVTIRILEELNPSPLASVSATIPDLRPGGMALRGVSGVNFDTPEICPAP